MLGFKRNLEINLNSKLVNRRRNSKNAYLASLKFHFLRMKNYAFLSKSSIYLFGW